MRAQPTDAERALWQELRGARLGVRFRRQHVVAGYIVDFYCARVRLVVEVDGGVHEATRAADDERTHVLEALGILVVRFKNEDVLGNRERTIERIVRHLLKRESLSLLPKSGEGRGSGEG